MVVETAPRRGRRRGKRGRKTLSGVPESGLPMRGRDCTASVGTAAEHVPGRVEGWEELNITESHASCYSFLVGAGQRNGERERDYEKKNPENLL